MSEIISVIVPVFKVEAYLDRCIESIVNQTYKNIEIILVDDGSPDRCPEMCDEWRKRDDRVKVLHKENEGVGFARNSGIEVSNGAYLMFVDSDDYLPLDAIESLYERIISDNSDLAIGKFIKVIDDGKELPSSYDWMFDTVIDQNEAFVLLGNNKKALHCYSFAKLYKNSIFTEVKFKKLTCGEDVDVLPRIIAKCEKISITSKVVYYYYQRSTSVVHNKNQARRMDSLKASVFVGRFLLDKNYPESAKAYYISSVMQIAEMKKKKEARNLLYKTFSKSELRAIKANGFYYRVAFTGMYIPYLYPFVLKMIRFAKHLIGRT